MQSTFNFIVSSFMTLLPDEFYLFPLSLFSLIFLIKLVKEIF